MFFILNYIVWVDKYWEQFHIFTDNIKNDVEYFLHKMQEFWPNFLFGLMKTGQFLSSHFDFKNYLIIFSLAYFILASEPVAS